MSTCFAVFCCDKTQCTSWMEKFSCPTGNDQTPLMIIVHKTTDKQQMDTQPTGCVMTFTTNRKKTGNESFQSNLLVCHDLKFHILSDDMNLWQCKGPFAPHGFTQYFLYWRVCVRKIVREYLVLWIALLGSLTKSSDVSDKPVAYIFSA